jgi:hypothetical protein
LPEGEANEGDQKNGGAQLEPMNFEPMKCGHHPHFLTRKYLVRFDSVVSRFLTAISQHLTVVVPM